MQKIKLCELFGPTVEGEGLYIGNPFIVIRTSGCNLKCDYCDTKFSSWWSSDEKEYSIEEILDYIHKNACKNISITGGEPLYRSEEELASLLELCKRLQEEKYFIKFETNATIFRPEFLPYVDFWSLSPKLKGMGDNTYFNKEVVSMYLLDPIRSQLKFVVGARKENNTMEEDLQAIRKLIEGEPLVRARNLPVVLQPEGLTENIREYLDRSQLLVERVVNCNKIDWDFWETINLLILPQWHRLLWNNARRK